MSPTTREGIVPAPTPSMLDLIRLSPRLIFPPGGEDLYRQIALLTGLAPGQEVLDVACGKGIPLEYLVRGYGVQGSGLDPDPRLIEIAEARCRAQGIGAQAQFQHGTPDALPYRDGVFDVAIGELGLAARWVPDDTVRELVRVTRPGGWVVLIQLAWKAPVDPARQGMLTEHLGARPRMLVEWKRTLMDAGARGLHAEEWSSSDGAFRPRGIKPFYDFAEIFTLGEKVDVLRRAWQRWGWRGVRTVLTREREVHALLTRERILGLYLLKGRKAPAEAEPRTDPEVRSPGDAKPPEGTAAPRGGDRVGGGAPPETVGLPLFGPSGDVPGGG